MQKAYFLHPQVYSITCLPKNTRTWEAEWSIYRGIFIKPNRLVCFFFFSPSKFIKIHYITRGKDEGRQKTFHLPIHSHGSSLLQESAGANVCLEWDTTVSHGCDTHESVALPQQKAITRNMGDSCLKDWFPEV